MAQYKRKLKHGDRYWYKFDYHGKTYFSKAVYLSKNEARKAESILYSTLDQNSRNISQKSDFSLIQAINERLDFIQIKKSKRYYIDSKRYFKVFLANFGDISIKSITKAHIYDMLLETSIRLQKEGKDNYTVNAMLRAYKSLFNFIIHKHEINVKNPCLDIEDFSVNKELKYIPSINEIKAVLEICDFEQKELIEFVMNTGCRISEALRITGNDIKSDGIVLYTKKSKNSNLIPRKIPYLVNKMIKKDERLFSRWTDCPKYLEKKIKKLGVKQWGWHNLRHRKASQWSKEGKPLFEIMSLLGHSSLKTTQIYLQLINS
jgi:integrase